MEAQEVASRASVSKSLGSNPFWKISFFHLYLSLPLFAEFPKKGLLSKCISIFCEKTEKMALLCSLERNRLKYYSRRSSDDHTFLKCPIPGLFFLYFRLFYSNLRLADNNLPMLGFKLRTSCVRSNRSTNSATTTAQGWLNFWKKF